jgi:hypothetical protein
MRPGVLILTLLAVSACASDGGNYVVIDGVRHDLARASATLIGGRYIVRVATTTADACPAGDATCFTINLGFTRAGVNTCTSANDSASIGVTRGLTQSFTASFGGSCTMTVDAIGEIGEAVTVSDLDATVHDDGQPQTTLHVTGAISAIRE